MLMMARSGASSSKASEGSWSDSRAVGHHGHGMETSLTGSIPIQGCGDDGAERESLVDGHREE